MSSNNSSPLKGQRFLIAEDEALIAMLIEDVIERLGGEIVGKVKACDEALAALATVEPDAVILDVRLHGGTSEDVVAAAAVRRVPVLICTGTDPQALPTVFRDLPVLKKPWQNEQIEVALTQLLHAPH